MKNILKAVLAVILLIASWYGFYQLYYDGDTILQFVFLVQGFVWLVISYEWFMNCFKEEDRIPIFITEEEEWDWDEDFDNP